MPVYLDKANPQVWKSINAFSSAVSEAASAAGLSEQELELMKVRASQINGCAFCLDLHARGARSVGVPAQKLDVLPAWRESTLYTKREVALLGVVEAATVLPVSAGARAELSVAQTFLGDEVFAAAQWVSVAINAFNRVSILSHHQVRVRDADGKVVK